MKKIVLSLFIVFSFISINAQNIVTGTVIDNTGEHIMGASVSVDGTNIGTITDKKGKFKLDNVPEGKVKLVLSFPDFGSSFIDINVKGNTEAGKIKIEKQNLEFDYRELFTDRVNNTNSTIHFDTLKGSKFNSFNDNLFSLFDHSSVFVSTQGGGWNDHRVSVRGFGQENIGFFINGIPVNDAFTGDFDWSRWANIADFSESVQLQKGLGNTKLNSRALAGSFNFLTGVGDKKAGGDIKFSYSSGNAYKAMIKANSGLIGKVFSMSSGIINSSGSGIVDKTWHDSWSFYLGSRLKIKNKHVIDFFGYVTPNSHGQNIRQQNIASYSHDLAESIGDYNQVALTRFTENPSGVMFNSDWNKINTSYSGKQYRYGKELDRKYTDFLNSHEKYNENSIFNILWSAQWSNKITQLTSFYYTGINGGQTKPYGQMVYDFLNTNGGIIDFNAVNTSNTNASNGILVNDVDNQKSLGGISKLIFEWSRNLNSTLGFEYNTTNSDNFLEIRDLLGGKYFIDNASELRGLDFQAKLGDTIGSNYGKNTVRGGSFIQTEFTNDDLAFNFMFGWNGQIYSLTDRFKKGTKTNQKDSLYYLKSGLLSSYQAKIGVKYNINDLMVAYGNAGFSLRPALFSDVIFAGKSTIASEPESEYFLNYELGFLYTTSDKKMKARAGLYLISCNNEIKSFYTVNASGIKDVHYVAGISSSFKGIEIDLQYKLLKSLDLILSGSLSDNKFTNNISGSYTTYETGVKNEIATNYYLLNMKTGLAPATQFSLAALWEPTKNSELLLSMRHLRDYYSNWDMTSRIKEESDENGKLIKSWKIPPSTILDIRANHTFNIKSRYELTVFGTLNNILNSAYIQDATDNGIQNGHIIKDSKGNVINDHKAERAEVFVGLPRNFTIGLQFKF